MKENDFTAIMNKSISQLLKDSLRISLKNPSMALFIKNTIVSQKKAATIRLKNEEDGFHVPAFMIASITHRCNLRCKGCYAQAQYRRQDSELDVSRMKSMVQEAKDLGISIILLAGGEPLVRKNDIMAIARENRDVIFPTFTNGLLLNDTVITALKGIKNLIPVISIEGNEEDTDTRRGDGVHQHNKGIFRQLKDNNIFYGTSITVTRENFDTVTDESFIRELIAEGCKLFFFVEYVPVKEETDTWVITEEQREGLSQKLTDFRENLSGLFIAFPGDEKRFGGCLASGRGFIHVSPEGNVEPCPFAPFSDSNIKDKSLKGALQSDFLRKIRENHDLLVEGQGGCALWEKRNIVESFLP